MKKKSDLHVILIFTLKNVQNFQKIDYENEGQDFKTPLTSSNFDTDSSLEWSSYESEPETTDDYIWVAFLDCYVMLAEDFLREEVEWIGGF